MFKTFFRFMRIMENRLFIYLGAILISTIGDAGRKIANSYLIKNIISAAQTGNTNNILKIVLGNFAVFVFCLLLWRFGIIRYNIEGRTGTGKLEKLVFSKAMRLPMSYYENNHSSDFMSRLIFDTQKASDIYTSRLRRLLSAIISTIIYLILMFYLSFELTLCFIAISLLDFIINSLFAKPMKTAGRNLSDKNSKILEKLTNILSGMELIKIFPIGSKLSKEYNAANEEYFNIQKRTNRLSAGLECINCMFDLIGALAFLVLGIWFVSLEKINLGELTALYTIYGSFCNVFFEIGQYFPQMMNCIANAEKIFEFLDMDEEPKQWNTLLYKDNNMADNNTDITNDTNIADNADIANDTNIADNTDITNDTGITNNIKNNNITGSKNDNNNITDNIKYCNNDDIILSMENINFSYDNKITILKSFSMQIKKGSYTAIVGESGCGKSTLAKILLGFYPAKSGNIFINGKDYNSLTLKEIREQIAYVPQEPYLYETTISENIAYGRYGADQEEIIAAAKAANAHDFIIKLPNGYDTILGERGNTLSGGEKQRIAIARAILRNTPIMLLDEATSALDNESEALIQESVKALKHERTILMIAHRPSTIASADTIVHVGT